MKHESSHIESELVNSVEVGTDYQSSEIAPIWDAVTIVVDGLRERDARIAALEGALVEALDGWYSHQESRDDQAQYCDEDRIAELRKLVGGAE